MKLAQEWKLGYSGDALRVYSATVDVDSVDHCLTQLEILQEQDAEESGIWKTRAFLTEDYNGLGGEIEPDTLKMLAESKPEDYTDGEVEVYQELYRKYLSLKEG